MKKGLLILLIISICLFPFAPAGAVLITPIVDPALTNPHSDMYVPEFSISEQDVFTATGQKFDQTIEQLRQLDKKYPGRGFKQVSDQLITKYDSYNKAGKSKGWTVWGDAPAYVSADNTVCFTDGFFGSRYSYEERMSIILHELVHLEQYRAYRFGANLLNTATLGFIAKFSETDSYIEEYKWLRVMGMNNSFEMQNVLKALVEQGVISSTKDTDNLDRKLGIQEIARITAQGLEAALNGEDKELRDPSIIQLDLHPGYSTTVPGAFTYKELPTNPNRVPASAQLNFAFTVPAPGEVTIKCQFASTAPADAPRFSGDVLGYRKQAYIVIKTGSTSDTISFNNGYNQEYNSLSDTRRFPTGAQVQVTIVPQGVTAGISPVTGEMKPMPDGAGYIYYGGASVLDVSFIPVPDSSSIQGYAPSMVPDVRVLINGEDLICDTPPTIIEGRTLVPMAAIFNALGAEVSWEESTRTVTGIKGNTVIKLQLDSTSALINGQTSELDVPAAIINSRTMVPLGFIALSLGQNVQWDGESRTVTISS